MVKIQKAKVQSYVSRERCLRLDCDNYQLLFRQPAGAHK